MVGRYPCCSGIILSFLLLSAPTARAEEPRKGGFAVTDLISIATPITRALTVIDKLAEKERTTAIKLFPQGFAEKASLVFTFRHAGVQAEAELPSWLPGRGIKASIAVDCHVHLWIDLKDLRVEFDPDYPDTVTLYLPKLRVTSSFPEGVEANYRVDYGIFRNKKLNKDEAQDLRQRAYNRALQAATERVSSEELAAYRAEAAQLLQSILRKHQFSGIKRIYVH